MNYTFSHIKMEWNMIIRKEIGLGLIISLQCHHRIPINTRDAQVRFK